VINKILCTLGLCLFIPLPLHAQEIKYVTDVLLLSLHEQEGSQGELLKRLPSGTRLEVLEEAKLFSKVRTEEGLEGWTKSGFLTHEVPARTRVLELEQQQEKLNLDLTQKQNELNQTKQRLAELMSEQEKQSEELARKEQGSADNASLIERLQRENQEFRQSINDSEIEIPQRWAMIAAPLLLLLGFIAGIAWFDYRSRKRHGGYRIY
jgi:SH3 domain protein